MTINNRFTRRYSISFKRQVVRELEQSGISKNAIRQKYKLGCATLHNWIRKFGKDHLINQIIRIETMEEKNAIKQLQQEIKKLKLALADSLLAQRSLEKVIEEADKEYKTDLKKSFGDDQSKSSAKSSA